MDSSSTARFCVFENALMDFSKMVDVARPGRSTGSRKWAPGFLATHCDRKHSKINYYEVVAVHASLHLIVLYRSKPLFPLYFSLLPALPPQFYQPSVDPASAHCDYVVPQPVLAYSHDDIQNLGHSMSDFMNVWLMLWLSQTGARAQDMLFLNIDALRMGHNYHDVLSQFGL